MDPNSDRKSQRKRKPDLESEEQKKRKEWIRFDTYRSRDNPNPSREPSSLRGTTAGHGHAGTTQRRCFRQRSYRHRAERSRAAAPHVRACWGSDHRPKAVRRRRASPRASARAGEGPLGGAATPLASSRKQCRGSSPSLRKKGKGKRKETGPSAAMAPTAGPRRLDGAPPPPAEKNGEERKMV